MRQPSKGPWSTGPLGDFNKVYDADDMLVCQTYQTDELSYVNARLIATVPKKHEALESIIEETINVIDGLTRSELYEVIDTIRDIAKSALAQAEGR